MNAAPGLGLKFLNARGQPLRKPLCQSDTEQGSTSQSYFLEAVVEKKLLEGAQVWFEPDPDSLELYGLGAPESLVRVTDGKACIPMVNYQQKVVHLDKGMRLGQAELVSEEEWTVWGM